MLTPKQQRFVAEYLIDLNGTQAAIRAGYSRRTANEQAARLLAKVSIRDAVAAGQAGRLEQVGLTATRVLEELSRIAFSDIRGLFDDRGNPKPIHQVTDEHAAAIGAFTVLTSRDGETTAFRIRLWDKVRALELLAKHVGLLADRVDVQVSLDEEFIRRLHAGRQRVWEEGQQ